MDNDFWRRKFLADMDDREWESLCDGCGRCCLHKLEDEDTGELSFTRVACRLLDIDTCRCRHYPLRQQYVPDCINLRRDFTAYHWLPSTCAYRRRHEGLDLPGWHPLVTSRAESVHEAGISVRHIAIPESEVADPEDYVIDDFD